MKKLLTILLALAMCFSFAACGKKEVTVELSAVPTLKNWRTDDQNEVLDILENEIQSWSKRKEQMFKRGLLSNALNYLRTAIMN